MKSYKRSAARRSGFTLIELLVVISIIGILASLILPGVMSARRAARRAQCMNNIRQVGMAILQIVTTKNKFPASGYWNVTTSPPDCVGDAMLTCETWISWTFGLDGSMLGSQPNGATGSHGLKYSWIVETLPYLEHSDIYDLWDFTANSGNFGAYTHTGGTTSISNWQLCSSTTLNILTCPEDITALDGQGNNSYVVNGGFATHWLVNDGASGFHSSIDFFIHENLFKMGLMFLDTTKGETSAKRRHKLKTVRDGLSTTVMMSENTNAGVSSDNPWVSNWGCPHPFSTSFFVNGGDMAVDVRNNQEQYSFELANVRGPRAPPLGGPEGGINGDLSGLNDGRFPYPNSFHTGGVHVVMCDGATKFVSDDIAGEIWARLVTPDGGHLRGHREDNVVLYDFEPIANRQIPQSEDQIP